MTKATAPTQEIGYAQNTNYQWWMYENETTPELIWPQSVFVFDQMRRTDAQVTSVLRAVTLPVRRTPWRIDPNGARKEVVEFIADDLGLPVVGQNPKAPPRSKDRFEWATHLRQALLMLPFGHMYFEIVFRVDKDGAKAHLRKLAPRMPKTIQKINVAEDGGLISIEQYWMRKNAQPTPIPVNRLVAYINDLEGGNWLGTSILRPAYKNWLLKDRLLRVQAQTIERNGMGIPLYTGQEDASPTDLAAGLAMAKAWRSGDAAGSAVPHGAELSLVGVSGTLPDAEPAIRYHDEQIARAVLAHFLNLGTQTGSWALGTTFADFFTLSLQTLAQQIADTATSHVIEDIVDVNFGEDEPAPRLVFDEIGSRQQATASAIASLVQAGIIQPDEVLEETSRQQYGLPPKDTETQRNPDGTVGPPPEPAPAGAAVAPADGATGDNSVASDGWVAASAEVDEDQFLVDAIVAAIREFTGEIQAKAGPDFDRLHPRGAHGKFRDVIDRIIKALGGWSEGRGPDDPLPESQFSREHLREAAKQLHVPVKRGADRDAIHAALIDHTRETTRTQRQAPPKSAKFTLEGTHRDLDVAVYKDKDGHPALFQENDAGVRGPLVERFDNLEEMHVWAQANDEPRLAQWVRSEQGIDTTPTPPTPAPAPAKKAVPAKKAAPKPRDGFARLTAKDTQLAEEGNLTPAQKASVGKLNDTNLEEYWTRRADGKSHLGAIRGLGAARTGVRGDRELPAAKSAPRKAVKGVPAKRVPAKKGPALTGDAALAAAPIDFTKWHQSGLTPDEDAVFADYVVDGAYGTNPTLRTYKGHTDPHDDATVKDVRLMDAAMSRSPLKADVQVERGISHGADEKMFGEKRWRGDLTGATMVDHGYQSTTARAGGAAQYAEQEGDRFEQATLRIRVPAGTQAIKLSGADHEDELLLQRGLTIKVVSDSGYNPKGGRVIEAEVIPGKVDAPAMMTGAEFDRMTYAQRRRHMKASGFKEEVIESALGPAPTRPARKPSPSTSHIDTPTTPVGDHLGDVSPRGAGKAGRATPRKLTAREFRDLSSDEMAQAARDGRVSPTATAKAIRDDASAKLHFGALSSGGMRDEDMPPASLAERQRVRAEVDRLRALADELESPPAPAKAARKVTPKAAPKAASHVDAVVAGLKNRRSEPDVIGQLDSLNLSPRELDQVGAGLGIDMGGSGNSRSGKVTHIAFAMGRRPATSEPIGEMPSPSRETPGARTARLEKIADTLSRQSHDEPGMAAVLEAVPQRDLRALATHLGVTLPKDARTPAQVRREIAASLNAFSMSDSRGGRGTPGAPSAPNPDTLDSTGARGLSSDPAVRAVQIENRIRAAYREAQRQPGDWVPLTSLRAATPDLSREELDAGLKSIAMQPGAHLIPWDNLKALSKADHEASVRFGGGPNHVLRLEDPSPRPLPDSTPSDGLDAMDEARLRSYAQEFEISGARIKSADQLRRDLRAQGIGGPDVEQAKRQAEDAGRVPDPALSDPYYDTPAMNRPASYRTRVPTVSAIPTAADEKPGSRVSQAQDQVRAAVDRIIARKGGEPGDWVGLAELRRELPPDFSREEFDKALVLLNRTRPVRIVPESNQNALTQRDWDAAVLIGDQPRHAISIAPPTGLATLSDADLAARASAAGIDVTGLSREQLLSRLRDRGITDNTGEAGAATARARQESIDSARTVAQHLSEVDELVANDASSAALESRIAAARQRGVPEDILSRVEAAGGDPAEVDRVLAEIAQENGLTPVGKAGDLVPFDASQHDVAGGGAQPQPGTLVRVVRPGYTYDNNGELVQLDRATVFEATPEEIAAEKVRR